VEDGFSRGPAGVGRRLLLPRQPGPAGADPAVRRPAGLPVVVPESGQRGAGDRRRLGGSDNAADPAVEQSGSGVS